MKSAMQQLKDKILEEVQNLKEPAQLNEHINGYREALKNISNDIDAQMLELERQQMQDALNHGLDNHVPISGLGYRQIAFNKYYNETFSK